MGEEYQEFEDEEIKQILREALKVKIEEKRKLPRKNQLNLALSNTIMEFLNCYKLMGYDMDGNPISMTIYNDEMQKSALDNLFMVEIGKFMAKR
jgi:hypothetical protein